MSEQLTVVAHLVAKADKIDETKAFLLGLVAPTRREPGCVEYHLHQDNENPAEFTFYENWTNRGEWDTHMTLPHLLEFARRSDELFAVKPHIRLMTMISGSAAIRAAGGGRPRSRQVLTGSACTDCAARYAKARIGPRVAPPAQ